MHSQAIGFMGALAVLFIGLKLGEVGVVALWPWWLVLSPIWAPVAATVIVAAVFLLGMAAAKTWRR